MFQFVAIVRIEKQFYIGSNEDEPGPTGKVIKHLTSSRLLRTVDRKSPNLAQKSVLRSSNFSRA